MATKQSGHVVLWKVNEICDGEMGIEYDGDEENFFMTHAEFLTVIHLGDVSFAV